MAMEVDMDTLRLESPAPWETAGALTDPIQVDNMIDPIYRAETQKSRKTKDTFDRRLIRRVRRHRALYDPTHKNFTNAEVKAEIWEKVAKKLNSDADACKNAWVDLRYCYQIYVRRLRKFFANKIRKKTKLRRPIMAFETEMIFLWRFIGDKTHCPLPYDKEYVEKETTPPTEISVEDDDLVLVDDEIEVIDLDDDVNKFFFSRHLKGQFLITPEMRRLIANIEPYEELYDCTHRYYEDYRRKGIIWNAIANEVGDKATKLMKCWIQIQTRYEWEVMQRNMSGSAALTKPYSELEHLLSFFMPHILKMPLTVYKSSYYLKNDWCEPIDHFKNIFSLLVAMKKYPAVITLTEGVSKSFSMKNCTKLDEAYTKTWTDVAFTKAGGVTPGQCETTWLILRAFYWELVNMRKHSYQLQDKWYFETIISELYALANVHKPQSKTKPTDNSVILSNTPTPSPLLTSATSTTAITKPTTNGSGCNITIKLVEGGKSITSNEKQQQQKAQPNAEAVNPITNNSKNNTGVSQPTQQKQQNQQALTTFVPTPVNFDEDKITSSMIQLVQVPKPTVAPTLTANINKNNNSTSSSKATNKKAQNKTISNMKQKESSSPYPQSKSPQIRVKSQAELLGLPQQQEEVNHIVQTHPQLQIKPQAPPTLTQVQQAIGQLKSVQQYNNNMAPQQQMQTCYNNNNMQQQLPQPQSQIQQQQQQLVQLLQQPTIPPPFSIMPPNAVVQIPNASISHVQTLPSQELHTSYTTPTNMGQLLPPVAIEPLRFPNPQTATLASSSMDTLKTPKIVSAVSLAPRASFVAPFVNKGLQITAVTGGAAPAAATISPPPPPLTHSSGSVHIRPTTPLLPQNNTSPNINASATSLSLVNSSQNNVLNLPYTLPDNTNITQCTSPVINSAKTTLVPSQARTTTLSVPQVLPPLSQQLPPLVPTGNQFKDSGAKTQPTKSVESKIPANFLARPHVTPTAQLNANEIMIELISSVNGNQLVVHGPPLERKYSLSMITTALLIREVLSIPYLHKKDFNKPHQVNIFWQYVAKRFNLPVHICKACWNFLSENFAHFPQIAPIEELTKPAKLGINVWCESQTYFQSFDEKAAQLGLPAMKNSVEKFFDNIREQARTIPRVPGQKLMFVADWRAALDTSNDKFLTQQWYSTWNLFKNAFKKYMADLENGIDNRWSLIWWRVLAKLDFLLEEEYHSMEPYYYIVRNKMIEECERCVKRESLANATADIIVKTKKSKLSSATGEVDDSLLLKIPDVDPYRVVMAVRRYPKIYQKCTEEEKNKAWAEMSAELQVNVTSLRFAFQQALKNYRLYVSRDPANRCRLNLRYYKHMAEICKVIKPKPTKKLNIKTPTELNQTVSENLDAPEVIFPERFVMDINMSNSNTDLVMKNWAYGLAIAGIQDHKKLEEIFDKYRSPDDIMILS
ncbi:uncharacterized protein Hmr isoform X1 [Eurosta solidaginis]|uniref:uncharacterized protein Hmr isoform X1 n=2 Tax=Eurosta solidaginis TaxID=178769 RepID=UPI0035314769